MGRLAFTNLAALLFLIPLFLTTPFSAAEAACANGRCWGAVGIGPGGAWGSAYNLPSERSAANVVQRKCGGNCTNVQTFFNTCGALAEGSSGGWGWAWHGNSSVARRNALGHCRARDRNCTVRAWACTSR